MSLLHIMEAMNGNNQMSKPGATTTRTKSLWLIKRALIHKDRASCQKQQSSAGLLCWNNIILSGVAP